VISSHGCIFLDNETLKYGPWGGAEPTCIPEDRADGVTVCAIHKVPMELQVVQPRLNATTWLCSVSGQSVLLLGMPLNAARLELQGRWRDRLETARQKYNVAVVRCTTVKAEQTQCSLPAPDGSHAFRIARQEESAARNEYMRLVRVVNDLIIQGIIPEEP
jgi:hypothetical protein